MVRYEKGGFIEQDDGPYVFLHYNSISGDGFKNLKEGQIVNWGVYYTPAYP